MNMKNGSESLENGPRNGRGLEMITKRSKNSSRSVLRTSGISKPAQNTRIENKLEEETPRPVPLDQKLLQSDSIFGVISQNAHSTSQKPTTLPQEDGSAQKLPQCEQKYVHEGVQPQIFKGASQRDQNIPEVSQHNQNGSESKMMLRLNEQLKGAQDDRMLSKSIPQQDQKNLQDQGTSDINKNAQEMSRFRKIIPKPKFNINIMLAHAERERIISADVQRRIAMSQQLRFIQPKPNSEGRTRPRHYLMSQHNTTNQQILGVKEPGQQYQNHLKIPGNYMQRVPLSQQIGSINKHYHVEKQRTSDLSSNIRILPNIDSGIENANVAENKHGLLVRENSTVVDQQASTPQICIPDPKNDFITQPSGELSCNSRVSQLISEVSCDQTSINQEMVELPNAQCDNVHQQQIYTPLINGVTQTDISENTLHHTHLTNDENTVSGLSKDERPRNGFLTTGSVDKIQAEEFLEAKASGSERNMSEFEPLTYSDLVTFLSFDLEDADDMTNSDLVRALSFDHIDEQNNGALEGFSLEHLIDESFELNPETITSEKIKLLGHLSEIHENKKEVKQTGAESMENGTDQDNLPPVICSNDVQEIVGRNESRGERNLTLYNMTRMNEDVYEGCSRFENETMAKKEGRLGQSDTELGAKMGAGNKSRINDSCGSVEVISESDEQMNIQSNLVRSKNSEFQTHSLVVLSPKTNHEFFTSENNDVEGILRISSTSDENKLIGGGFEQKTNSKPTGTEDKTSIIEVVGGCSNENKNENNGQVEIVHQGKENAGINNSGKIKYTKKSRLFRKSRRVRKKRRKSRNVKATILKLRAQRRIVKTLRHGSNKKTKCAGSQTDFNKNECCIANDDLDQSQKRAQINIIQYDSAAEKPGRSQCIRQDIYSDITSVESDAEDLNMNPQQLPIEGKETQKISENESSHLILDCTKHNIPEQNIRQNTKVGLFRVTGYRPDENLPRRKYQSGLELYELYIKKHHTQQYSLSMSYHVDNERHVNRKPLISNRHVVPPIVPCPLDMCQLPSCFWLGFYRDRPSHVSTCHRDVLMHGTYIKLAVPATAIISAFNELFVAYTQREQNMLHCVVRHACYQRPCYATFEYICLLQRSRQGYERKQRKVATMFQTFTFLKNMDQCVTFYHVNQNDFYRNDILIEIHIILPSDIS